jgi:hypothetical protein
MAAVFGCGVILWIEKRGVGMRSGDRKALEWIIQRKKVRPKKSATSYETVAVLPLAGLCCGSCGGRMERSFFLFSSCALKGVKIQKVLNHHPRSK